MEFGPERQDDEKDDDAVPSRPDPSGPSTGGVRIIGAETAAEITSELPIVPPAHITSDGTPSPSVRIIDEPVHEPTDETTEPEAPVVPATELPHWTEPATGQVPAVLARDEGEANAILPPTWREGDADWTAHEEEFEPSMFSDERTALGALDETRNTDQERRPWEFDLDSVRPGQPGPAAGSTPDTSSDPITEPVEVVSASVPTEDDRPLASAPGPEESGEATSVIFSADIVAAGAAATASDMAHTGGDIPGSPAGEAAEAAEAADDVVRPSGNPRVGRARRSGLLPGRLKAKRPDDDVAPIGEPLAAEPPGASVADVPGAGRRKPGLAGLAAADRAADHEQSHEAATVPSAVAAVDEATGVSRSRRRLRGSAPTPERAPRSSSNYTPDVTGGGPPDPAIAHTRHETDEHGGGSTGLRIGTGVAVAVVALLAFKIGTVTSLILCLVVVTFSAGEAFAVLKRSGWRPATLLGLVGTISLMVGAYNKGIAALPLVMVLVTVFTLLWYLFGVERGSAVAGSAATLLVVGWVALLGSFAGLLLARPPSPTGTGSPSCWGPSSPPWQMTWVPWWSADGSGVGSWPPTSAPTRPGRAWPAGRWPRSSYPRWRSGRSTPGRRPTPPFSGWWSPSSPRWVTSVSHCSSATFV